MSDWESEINKINHCSQVDDTKKAQIRNLCYVADKLGFYEASDSIRDKFLRGKNEQ